IDGLVLQDMRIYGRTLSGQEVDHLVKGTRGAWLLTKKMDKRSDAEKNELYGWWLITRDSTYQALTKKVNGLRQEESTIKSRGTRAHVRKERQGEPMASVLFRGEYDKRRDPVKPGTPKSLPPFPSDLPSNRLGFAQWLLRPENPLTARVTVNRFW